MKIIHFLILIFGVINIVGCFNPFFPEKGNPLPVESTPERTVQLFREAYERKDIFAFQNLIYDTTQFSSFTQVTYDYSASLNIFSGLKLTLIDSIFFQNTILPKNRDYYELKWGQEKNIHDIMFRRSDEILFLDGLVVTNSEYDVLWESDTVSDTVSALVKIQSSKMRIVYGATEYLFDITGQIFAMKKKNGFWKIWKWIELN